MFEDFRILLKIKRYSTNTSKSYIALLTVFQKFIGYDIPLNTLNDFTIYNKVGMCIIEKKYSYTTQKQLLSAIKLFLFEIHNREIDFTKIKPRKSQQILPQILSPKEIASIINQTTNLKHKAMLATLYGLGLRSGELINLKISDLDKDRNCIFIHQAKGRKDRMLPFPKDLKLILRSYYLKYTPKEYLFEGQKGGKYSTNSMRAVFKVSCKRAGITKKVTCHNLRHSYATHLLENGTSLPVIQTLLGHTNIKTTLIYTKVSSHNILNVQSPLGFLELKHD